ncbi:hypothetical protein PRIPAC_91567 [Pristionchus pacificus]|uniref:Uncharacterized protein n=1 Tax=Pristionchus pacificus TaxID=54126 RepID=A0A2A6CE10_PRIPA|nr:hypothetical protein PRIPAC_91567 [Pristionchus pacificus]|eukprot:PDM76347.1 hypothetical protein PRIPAC_39951 [Pristionchus pacificus]
MARSLLALAGVVSLAAVINSQCALGDHPNCVNWKRNGFCVNGAYTKIQKQQYCPSCPEAGCSGEATTAATKENANCGKWNTAPDNVFCARADITVDQKKTFCFKTCEKELATTPADDCAYYKSDGKVVTRTGIKKETTAATVNDTKATATEPLVYIYARKGCIASVYAASTTPAPGAPAKEYNGDNAPFTKVGDTEKASAGFGCKCT